MQQRYYDPMLGVFLSVDPITANPSTGENFNRYAYVDNNPYRYTDPDGRGKIGIFIKLIKKVTTKEGRQFQTETLKRVPTEKAAVTARQSGKNVVVEGSGKKAPASSTARGIEERVSGKANTERHDAHGKSDRQNSGDTENHYQPSDRGKDQKGMGHTIYKGLGALTAVGNLPSDAGPWLRGAAEAVDFVNPVSDVKDVIDLVRDIDP